jgi:hypothetical protein
VRPAGTNLLPGKPSNPERMASRDMYARLYTVLFLRVLFFGCFRALILIEARTASLLIHPNWDPDHGLPPRPVRFRFTRIASRSLRPQRRDARDCPVPSPTQYRQRISGFAVRPQGVRKHRGRIGSIILRLQRSSPGTRSRGFAPLHQS